MASLWHSGSCFSALLMPLKTRTFQRMFPLAPVTRNRVPDREEKGKPINDARHGRCHPLE